MKATFSVNPSLHPFLDQWTNRQPLRLSGLCASNRRAGRGALYSLVHADPAIAVVGDIESSKFDLETRTMRYRMFVKAPYDKLVSTSTRFWDVSGVSLSASSVEGCGRP